MALRLFIILGLFALPPVCSFLDLSHATEFEKGAKTSLDTAVQEIGKAGESKGGVYKISLPRTDLSVTVDGVKVKPGLALGSWMAFKPAGKGAVAHGDLVLTEDEVFSVVRELEEHGLRITGLHNHLINESPRVMYLHFWGEGEPEKLAHGLKEALRKTQTPITVAKNGETAPEEAGFDAEQIQAKLGHKGTVKEGVLKISVPRPEPITAHGTEFPPSMGMATAINLQAAGDGKVVATGDFVMIAEEVAHVARALEENGITVTALHNHLLHSSPALFFMHFWAHDTSEKTAQGLKAALDAMKRVNKREVN